MQHKIGIPEGCTAELKIEDGFAVITVNEKFEPKDGDFVTISYEGKSIIFIYKDKYKIDENADCYKSYLFFGDVLSKDRDIIASPYAVLSRSTKSEKLQLLNELAKGGKRWNAEAKCIESIKFKPTYEQTYFYPILNGKGLYSSRIWRNEDADRVLFEAGMCFKTSVEATEMTTKILKG